MGGFDDRLGRNGDSLAAGEETIIYRRLIAQQARVVYLPDAPVGHRLKPAEYTAKNIEKKFMDGADSSLKVARYLSKKNIFGRPIYPLKIAILSGLKSIILLPYAMVRMSQQANRDVFYLSLQMKRTARLIKLWVAKP